MSSRRANTTKSATSFKKRSRSYAYTIQWQRQQAQAGQRTATEQEQLTWVRQNLEEFAEELNTKDMLQQLAQNFRLSRHHHLDLNKNPS